MAKFLLKNFLILLSLALFSCSKNSDTRKIRIVDLQGKSHPVKTRVPELNAQILESQGRLQQEENSFGNVTNNGQNPSQNPMAQPIVPEAANVNQMANPAQVMPETITPNKYATADYSAAASELAKQNSEIPTAPIASNSPKDNLTDGKGQTFKVVAGGIPATKEAEIEYDLADTKKSSKSPKMTFVSVVSAKEYSGIFVQTGAFSTMENAKKSLSTMQKFAKGQIEESGEDRKLYRVLLGPFTTKIKAKQVLGKIKSAGHEAVIVRKK